MHLGSTLNKNVSPLHLRLNAIERDKSWKDVEFKKSWLIIKNPKPQASTLHLQLSG